MAEGEPDKRVYIFDSSSWIAADGNPMSNRIRVVLQKLLEEGRIFSPKQVFDELKSSGAYTDWARENRRRITYPPRMNDDYGQNVGLVQHSYPGMGRALGRKERADPWVVGAAFTEAAKGTVCCVVTTETPRNRPNRKIAGACDGLGLDWTTLDQLLEDESLDEER